MTEELKQKAENYCNHLQSEMLAYTPENPRQQRTVTLLDVEEAYIAGATENCIQWHDLKENPSDVPKGENIHRKVLLQDRYGDIYTGNYYPKDDCHPEDCFSVEYLEYGFQGCNFVAFEQIAKWAEFKE